MFLPTTRAEMEEHGWDACDIVIITPDAYVDHPSFAMAILGRFLEKHGYRVGIISQPHWKSPDEFLSLGVPKICFAVSGGNIDSMVLNYTSSGKPRKTDQYCEAGNPWFSSKGDAKKYRIRPDRVVTVYSNQIRAACKGVPLIIGGVEASLRRIAHYDWWSDKVKRSVLFDAKADILIYGMGEYPLLEVVRKLEKGIQPDEMEVPGTAVIRKTLEGLSDPLILPSFEEVKKDKKAFAEAFCEFSSNSDCRVLAQQQDTRFLVQFPRREITEQELDAIYETDFERRPHPAFRDIPAFTMIRDSITSHRGCYGNCSFCSIAAHQGRTIISRSRKSILREARAVVSAQGFHGTITDVGGPSANMYASCCKIGGCDDPDCLNKGKNGGACSNLKTDLREYLGLLQDVQELPGVKHVFVNSGLRYDHVLMNEAFLREMLHHHISGQMKVAPESGSERVLSLMNKPDTHEFASFKALFEKIKKEDGIRNYVIPYIIVGHPGEGEKETKETLEFLRRHDLRGHQFQIFTPTPLTLSTAIYYLGFHPSTGKPLETEKKLRVLEKRKETLIGN